MVVRFPTDLGVLGGLICYEHSNALFRYALAGEGEEIHMAMWPGGMRCVFEQPVQRVRQLVHVAFCVGRGGFASWRRNASLRNSWG